MARQLGPKQLAEWCIQHKGEVRITYDKELNCIVLMGRKLIPGNNATSFYAKKEMSLSQLQIELGFNDQVSDTFEDLLDEIEKKVEGLCQAPK